MRNEGISIESRPRQCAVVGGGAAGFFLALNLKEMCPEMQVTILERSQHVLAKVAISGGGRCNCTNSFAQVRDLSEVYPRGHRLLKRLFHLFGPRDAYEWFERHGVELTTQDDECVFPSSQDSKTIIDCFLNEAHRHGIDIKTCTPIQSLDELQSFAYVAITTGGHPKATSLQWLADAGHEIEQPVPSLFTFNIDDERLRSLMGTVCEHASMMLPQTKFRSTGPLLVTHWGLSGPATLKLSSHAARWLHERNYQSPAPEPFTFLPPERETDRWVELTDSAGRTFWLDVDIWMRPVPIRTRDEIPAPLVPVIEAAAKSAPRPPAPKV